MPQARFLFKLLIFSVLAHPLFAQAPPEPSALSSDWWEYFETDTPNDKVEATEKHLNELLSSLSEENKEEGKQLVQRSIRNLKAYAQLKEQPLPVIPAPKPIATSYNMDEVIELNRNMRKITIELQAAKDELQDQTRQLKTTQNYLNNLQKNYNSAKERTEEKLLLGLEVLALRTAVELTQERIELFTRRVEVEKALLGQQKQEIEVALDRISIPKNALGVIEKKTEEAKATWNQKKKVLTAKELEAALYVPSPSDPQSEAHDQLLNQETIQAHIQETEAHVNLIGLEIKSQLAHLTKNPKEIDTKELRKKIDEWTLLLSEIRTRNANWSELTQRQIQTTSQILSLEEDKQSPLLILKQQQTLQIAYDNILALQRLQSEVEDDLFLLTEVKDEFTLLLPGQERWLQQTGDFVSGSLKKMTGWFSQALFYVGKTPITILDLIRFILIILFTIWIARWASHGLNSILTQKPRGIRKAYAYRINRLFHYSILTIGFLFAFSTLGFDFTNLVLIAGALGVGLGFGLQSIFNNFVSGIIILFESYLRVGDFIEINKDLRGEIRAINFRSIIIRTNDGIDILIPNSDVINNRVINWTLNDPHRRMHIPFNVAYGSDKELVKKVIVEAAKQVEFTHEKSNMPAPDVRFLKFGESNLEFELAVWVTDKATRRSRRTRSAYLWAIDNALQENGIIVPFPQRDVHLFKKEN